MTDIYQPPSADVETPVVDDQQGPAWKGLLVGVITDVVGGILVGIVLVIGHTLIMFLLGQPIEDIADSWTELDFYSFQSLLVHIGAFSMTFLGAYLCVRIINHRVYFYAMIYAILSATIGLLMSIDSIYTIEQNILLTIIVFIVSFSAAWLHLYRQQQRSR